MAANTPAVESNSLTIRPIGYIRSTKQVKFDARHQPLESEPDHSVLELLPGQDFELALRDLKGFSRIWLIWWFHRNNGWRPLALPPRGPAQRRGLFATRSPYRPNPLGITNVALLGIKGRRLQLGPCDLVDGTPVFDIKPYIPAYDAYPEASAGWCDDVEQMLAAPPTFTVQLSPLAQEQAGWLHTQWQIDFRPRMEEILGRDPSPHRTRRIRRKGPDTCDMGCGAWRVRFRVEGTQVTVLWIDTGYPPRLLEDASMEDVPDRDAQRAFLVRWPTPLSGSDAQDVDQDPP